MFADITEWLGQKLDNLVVAIKDMLLEILEFFWDGFIAIIDFILWSLASIIFAPLTWLIEQATYTEFYQSFVDTLISDQDGLPALVGYVTILDSIVDWNIIVTILATGLTATLAILVFKVIAKLIPMIY